MKKILSLSYIYLMWVLMSCNTTSQPTETGAEMSADEFFASAFFHDVQMAGIFPDSKTFVDCVPKAPLGEIVEKYNSLAITDKEQLREFVMEHFDLPRNAGGGYETDTTKSMVEHIEALWPHLTRQPDSARSGSTLITLTHPYIVPGGRFREIYYWDSYFTMEGLMISGQQDMARAMVNNFAYLIDSIGFIPNGNRAYYLGRSQPPFFALMVNLVAGKDRDSFVSYLPALIKEHEFWMQSSDLLTPGMASGRVVMLGDSTILNRYHDNKVGPRPESYREDFELVKENGLPEETTYIHLRAGAESGWDYSSRWFANARDLSSIHTSDILPVDLNCLLYFLETMIAKGHDWSGNLGEATRYLQMAEKRKEAIERVFWSDETGFYMDFDHKEGRHTSVESLAGAFPLFFSIAPKSRARMVRDNLMEKFLLDGGFVTTLNQTGQQWDYPNGWAPLQWITINALMNYGHSSEALDAARRWLGRNERVYRATGKMMEKYNVADTTLLAGGGEYENQDGFGWTNGVALALKRLLDPM